MSVINEVLSTEKVYIELINKLLITINNLKIGDCWCGAPVDNPTFKTAHSGKCKETRSIMEEMNKLST
jgi:hypothetical protein